MATDNLDSEETNLLSLLKGISQQLFFDKHNQNNIKSLKLECYPQLSDHEFNQLHEKMSHLLKAISMAKMDLSQLQAFLTSRVKHREPAHRITEEQAKSVIKFWKSQSQLIVESLARRTKFNPALKDFSWRVDVAYPSKVSQLKNTAVVVLQMHLDQYLAASKPMEVEIDSKGMAKLFTSIKEIDNQIKNFVQIPSTNSN